MSSFFERQQAMNQKWQERFPLVNIRSDFQAEPQHLSKSTPVHGSRTFKVRRELPKKDEMTYEDANIPEPMKKQIRRKQIVTTTPEARKEYFKEIEDYNRSIREAKAEIDDYNRKVREWNEKRIYYDTVTTKGVVGYEKEFVTPARTEIKSQDLGFSFFPRTLVTERTIEDPKYYRPITEGKIEAFDPYKGLSWEERTKTWIDKTISKWESEKQDTPVLPQTARSFGAIGLGFGKRFFDVTKFAQKYFGRESVVRTGEKLAQFGIEAKTDLEKKVFTRDDRKPALSVFQYGELTSNIPAGSGFLYGLKRTPEAWLGERIFDFTAIGVTKSTIIKSMQPKPIGKPEMQFISRDTIYHGKPATEVMFKTSKPARFTSWGDTTVTDFTTVKGKVTPIKTATITGKQYVIEVPPINKDVMKDTIIPEPRTNIWGQKLLTTPDKTIQVADAPYQKGVYKVFGQQQIKVTGQPTDIQFFDEPVFTAFRERQLSSGIRQVAGIDRLTQKEFGYFIVEKPASVTLPKTPLKNIKLDVPIKGDYDPVRIFLGQTDDMKFVGAEMVKSQTPTFTQGGFAKFYKPLVKPPAIPQALPSITTKPEVVLRVDFKKLTTLDPKLVSRDATPTIIDLFKSKPESFVQTTTQKTIDIAPVKIFDAGKKDVSFEKMMGRGTSTSINISQDTSKMVAQANIISARPSMTYSKIIPMQRTIQRTSLQPELLFEEPSLSFINKQPQISFAGSQLSAGYEKLKFKQPKLKMGFETKNLNDILKTNILLQQQKIKLDPIAITMPKITTMSLLRQEQLQKQQLIQKQQLKLAPISITIPKTVVITSLRQEQLTRQQLIQKQQLKTTTTTTPISKFAFTPFKFTTPTIPLKIKIPFLPIPKLSGKPVDVISTKEKRPAYNTYVKEKGQWLKANKSNEKNCINTAIKLGAKITDHTVARSFKVKKASGFAKNIKATRPNLQKFYQPSKSRKPSLAGAYIEKSKYAIDTVGELQGITAKGWIARRKKKGLI